MPTSIISHLIEARENDSPEEELPIIQSLRTVVLFADVSGYTAMCEAMANSGPGGDEYLAKNLNSYFELLVRTISAQGGDVLKFAGDAILVIWPPCEEAPETLIRRAAQCGLDIKAFLQDASLSHGVRLSVKVGIGEGNLKLLHMGGVFGRLEYLAVGDPLVQAFHAEHCATKTELVLSPEAYAQVCEHFIADVLPSGHAYIQEYKDRKNILKKKKIAPQSGVTVDDMKNYIPTAVVPFAAQDSDKWINELRYITVLFVNLGLREEELVSLDSRKDITRMHNVLRAVQMAVYKYEGSLNKFLMDDKGSTLIAVFGLPPLAHEDDALRGVLSALDICDSLHQFDLRPSIGITTGKAFCGVVGTRNRREYSILGDTVNLSARIMQHATKTGAGVLVDVDTQRVATKYISAYKNVGFYKICDITVKGKSMPITILQPLQRDVGELSVNTHMHDWLRKERRRASSINPNDEEYKREPEEADTAIAGVIREGSGVVVVHSTPGLGGSELLVRTLATEVGEKDDNISIVFGAGDALDYSKRYKAWVEVFVQLVALNGAKPSGVRKFVRGVLDNDEDVALLADVLPWKFEQTNKTLNMTKGERETKIASLLSTLLKKLVVALTEKGEKVVVAMNNAEFLDALSWQLCFEVATKINELILIIVTRPMNRLYRGKFASPTPPQYYTKLVEMDNVVSVTRHPRSPVLIGRISAQSLCQKRKRFSYPRSLVRLMTDKCRGNPQYARELTRYFVDEQLIEIDDKENPKLGYRVKVCHRLCVPTGKPANRHKEAETRRLDPKAWATPLPSSIQCMIGARLDRLSSNQIWVLKIGALMGTIFPFDVIPKVFPLKQVDLDIELQGLLDLNVLQGTDEPNFYVFVDGCMRDAILARILMTHQETLIGKIKQHSHVFNVTKLPGNERESLIVPKLSSEDERMNNNKIFEDSVMEGFLTKQGGRFKTWKLRYFVLWSDKLQYYMNKDATKKGPKGEIPIGRFTLVEAAQNDSPNFLITPNAGDGGRSFEIKAESAEMAQRWISQMQSITKEKSPKYEGNTKGKSTIIKNAKGFRFSQVSSALMDEGNLSTKYFQESAKEGVLMKRGETIKTWKKRYFILFRDKLIYYPVPIQQRGLLVTKGPLGNIKGTVELSTQATVERSQDHNHSFEVRNELGGRRLIITARDDDECSAWMEAVQKCCQSNINNIKKIANHSVKEGFLRKKKAGRFNISWVTRYCVLFNNRLQYFENSDGTQFKGEFRIWNETVVEMVVGDDAAFSVTPYPEKNGKTYIMSAKDKLEASEWVKLLKLQIGQAPLFELVEDKAGVKIK